MEKMRQWSMLTAVAVVGVLALGWFALVSPQRSDASKLRSQTANQEAANATLVSQVNQLQQQQKGLPAEQRKVSSIQTKIPNNPALPGLIRQLSAAAKSSGVELVSLAPAQPALVAAAPAAGAATTGATSTSTTSTTSTSTGTTTGSGTTPAAVAPTLAQIPVTISVQGSFYNLNSFFLAVENLRRAMLVQGWNMAAAVTPGGASSSSTGGGTAPAKQLAPGTLTASLQAIVFLSPEVSATTPAATAAGSAGH
jgi:Tfp pilus assembly protein PilO